MALEGALVAGESYRLRQGANNGTRDLPSLAPLVEANNSTGDALAQAN